MTPRPDRTDADRPRLAAHWNYLLILACVALFAALFTIGLTQ